MAKIREAIEEFKPDPRVVDERGPTRERLRLAAGDIFVNDKGERHFRDTPIERAVTKKIINAPQYTAAQKYYNHWYRAGLSESIGSADLNRIFSADPSNMVGMAKTEAQAFHRQQYRKAVQILGIRQSGVFERVVCHGETFRSVGHSLGWNDGREANAVVIQMVRDAANDLCKDWGITS